MFQILLTMLIGVAGGMAALRLNMKGGGLIGAMFAVAAFNIATSAAVFPWYAKPLAQSVAGAFIAIPITLAQVKAMRSILKPAAIMVGGMLAGSILFGLMSLRVSDMTPISAFLASATGGMTDLVLISGDLGADPVQVSVMHTMRLFVVLGFCPANNKRIVQFLEARWPHIYSPHKVETGIADQEAFPQEKKKSLPLTLLVALSAGGLGYISGVPAGALVFALVAVCIFNLLSGKAVIPLKLRRFAQFCAGALIGCSITMENVAQAEKLLFPLLIILAGNILLNIVLGLLLFHFGKMDLRTALFATIPAGVADMALIAGEFNGDGSKVALLQMIRVIAAVTLFPTVYLLICEFM